MKLTTWIGTNSRKDKKPKSSPAFQNSATTANTNSAPATEATRARRYFAFVRAMMFPIRAHSARSRLEGAHVFPPRAGALAICPEGMRRLGDRFAPFAMKPVVDGARNASNQPCGDHNFRRVRRTHTHPLQFRNRRMNASQMSAQLAVLG